MNVIGFDDMSDVGRGKAKHNESERQWGRDRPPEVAHGIVGTRDALDGDGEDPHEGEGMWKCGDRTTWSGEERRVR
jgi:hypothetical protein